MGVNGTFMGKSMGKGWDCGWRMGLLLSTGIFPEYFLVHMFFSKMVSLFFSHAQNFFHIFLWAAKKYSNYFEISQTQKKYLKNTEKKHYKKFPERFFLKKSWGLVSNSGKIFGEKPGTLKKNKKLPAGPAPHPSIPAPLVPVPTVPPPDNLKTPLPPDGTGGHGKSRSETPKTPQNAPFVKRSISEKPRKTPGFHRDDYVDWNLKGSSF